MRPCLATLLAGCWTGSHPPAAPASEPAPVTMAPQPRPTGPDPACVTTALTGEDHDLDGEGAIDHVIRESDRLRVFVRDGDCVLLVDEIQLQGPIAFLDVAANNAPGMRDLVVDTWLHHGDRNRWTYRWSPGGYVASDPELVPGPRRPPLLRHPGP